MNGHEARIGLRKVLEYNFHEYPSPYRDLIKLEQELRAVEKFVEVAKDYLNYELLGAFLH